MADGQKQITNQQPLKAAMVYRGYFGNTRTSATPVAERLRVLFLLTAVSGVGSSPALATCETSQVLLAGMPGGFSREFSRFLPPTDWPASYELK